MLTISNDSLNITITKAGAELTSVFNKKNGIEYLWNGDPAFWPKHSPILFPVVGGLKNGGYQHEGNSYYFNRHGFARELTFEVAEQTDSSVSLFIETSEATLAVYPFDFKLIITYSLHEEELKVDYLVENKSDKDLLFSIGAHPAFNVPLVKGTEFDDYYLKFNEVENAGIYPIATDGLIKNDSVPFLVNTDKLPLTKSLFYNDALIFKDLKSTAISILNHLNGHGLTISYPDFPYMGLWNAKDANFVCIEPWCGIGDMENTTSQLSEKEGIVKLSAFENFDRTWSLKTF